MRTITPTTTSFFSSEGKGDPHTPSTGSINWQELCPFSEAGEES